MSNKISVVIPALNEEVGIVKTLEKIPFSDLENKGFSVEVIVVDNGSTDDTPKIAKKLGATVIKENKKGYGSAYKAGLKKASGDYIVTCDADGTYPIEDIMAIHNHLSAKNLDFITTNRFPDGIKKLNTMTLISKIGNFALSIFFRIIYQIKIKDSQSGMWYFKKNLLKDMILKSDGMSFSQEIKIEAIFYNKVKWDEYSIGYNKRVGNKKLKVLNDGFSNLMHLISKRITR